jgi:hypothetical protein
MDTAIISALLTLFFGCIFSVVGYLLVTRDKQRSVDLKDAQELIKETAALVLTEKEKTAALVLTESRSNAALVLSEREKLEARFKTDYTKLDEKFTEFRIKIAGEYATTNLVEKIMAQVTLPLTKKLDEIEDLLSTKLDRREFENHEKRQKLSGQ